MIPPDMQIKGDFFIVIEAIIQKIPVLITKQDRLALLKMQNNPYRHLFCLHHLRISLICIHDYNKNRG
jgi:hypothetical protein